MSTPEPNTPPRRLPWYVRLLDLPTELLARRLGNQATEYTPEELGPLPDHFVDLTGADEPAAEATPASLDSTAP